MSELTDAVLMAVRSNRAPTTMIICEVAEAPPKLHLKYADETIHPEQIYCSNYLLPHYHRDYTIDGVIDNIEIDVESYSAKNTTSTDWANGPAKHKHPIPTLEGSGEYKGNGVYQSHKDLWMEDTLKPGDEVVVAIVGVVYVVLNKITKMPGMAREGV